MRGRIDGDFVPDCDLLNLAGQRRVRHRSPTCASAAAPEHAYDPETLVGWGKRAYNWEFSAGVQQELSRASASTSATSAAIYGNFAVTDNRAVAATDYSPFQHHGAHRSAAAGRRRLHGERLYDLNPNKVGQVDNYVTFAVDFGNQIEHWNGIDVTMNARLRQRPPGAGRHQHRPHVDRQLRRFARSCPTTGALNPFCHVAHETS